jgi:hypothetical protein
LVNPNQLGQKIGTDIELFNKPIVIITQAENIKQAKGNECNQYKSTAVMFPSSLPICPVYFHLVMPCMF